MRHTLEPGFRNTPGTIHAASPPRRTLSSRWRPSLIVRAALAVAMASGIVLIVGAPASAFPTKLSPNGQLDFVFGSAVNSAGGAGGTVYKPESKLFYTGDGVGEPIRWWSVLGTSGPSPEAGVWLFELVDHNWVARMQLPDADPWAKADALYEGGTLYVSTRDAKATSGTNIRQSSLYEIPYNGSGTWGAVQGPFAITTGTLETLTLARDSANRIWVTYEAGRRIRVGYTAPGGTSFTFITVSQTRVKADDVSAIAAFGGNRIGVFWSDQGSKRDYFAWRPDSAPVTASWTIETALGGGVGNCPTATSDLCADDHMNVKVYQDQVYVAVKTGLNDAAPNDPNDPITTLLRRSSDGTWSSFPIATVSQNVTRPITVLSPTQDKIWVWATRGSEVDVWESSFTAPAFSSTAFIPWAKGAGAAPADPTATKQVTTPASGAVVMASTSSSTQYWHNEFLPAGPPPANTPPTAQGVTTTATSGVAKQITLTGTDAENCELTFNGPASPLPSGATVSAPTNVACTGAGPYQDTAKVTYTAPVGFTGPDSFTYTVNDGTVGSNTATVSITVSAPAPGTVTFRDAATGANDIGKSVTVPVPAATQAGDVLVAVVDVKKAPPVPTPSGWNLVSDTTNDTSIRQLVYWRVATASEPAGYSWSYSGTNRAASGAIAAYAGASTTAPIETFSAGTASSASITAPSVTTPAAGAMIVGAFGLNADKVITPPAGMTERGQVVSATRLRTEVADYAPGIAGATGDKIATVASGTPANIGQLIALRPA